MPRLFTKQNAWGAAVAALSISLLVRPAAADIIYDNGFEVNTNGFSYISSSNPGFTPFIRPGNTVPTTVLPSTATGFNTTPNGTYLGLSKSPTQGNVQFGFIGNTTLTLTLSGLTPGNQYLLGFDLFIGKAVEGNAPPGAGPDRFRVNAGATNLIDTTFNTYGPNDTTDGVAYARFGQAYRDGNLTGFGDPNENNAPFMGADVIYDAPGTSATNNYSIYYFGRYRTNAPTLLFTATGATTQIQWISNFTTPNVNNEFWAIDNVQVADLPEPGTLGMMLFAAPAAFGFYRLRRRKSDKDAS